MPFGIDDVESGAEHGTGCTFRVECRAMRLAVHAARQAAHHARTSHGKRPTQLTGDTLGIRRRSARSYDGDARPPKERKVPTKPERLGRPLQIAQRRGISLVVCAKRSGQGSTTSRVG